MMNKKYFGLFIGLSSIYAKVLKWDVELKLPHANSTLKLDFVPDTTKLWKLVAPLMEPGVSQDVLGYKASDLQLNEQQIQVVQ